MAWPLHRPTVNSSHVNHQPHAVCVGAIKRSDDALSADTR
jgi:hypothetical protein